MSVLLALLGCLATQGGPVWWASKHRAHHKFCDKPRDPHSAKLRGLIGAFAWFGKARRRRPIGPAPRSRRIAHPPTRPRALLHGACAAESRSCTLAGA